MPKWLPKKCRECGAKADDGVPISRRGLCYPCGHAAMVKAIEGMTDHRTVIYKRWRAAGGHLAPGQRRQGVGGGTRASK